MKRSKLNRFDPDFAGDEIGTYEDAEGAHMTEEEAKMHVGAGLDPHLQVDNSWHFASSLWGGG
jgi:hypothetical protein